MGISYSIIRLCSNVPSSCCLSTFSLSPLFWLWVGLERSSNSDMVRFARSCCFITLIVCQAVQRLIHSDFRNRISIILNGSTTQLILHLLNMDKHSASKKRLLEFANYEMLNKALQAFADLGDDEELGPADWTTVKGYIATLNNVEGKPTGPYIRYGGDGRIDLMHFSHIQARVHFLNCVRATYWNMLDEGRITQTTASILMPSVDEAVDLAPHEPLCDWKFLKVHAHFPNYCKFLQTTICPSKLVTYLALERLETACYICAGFLQAHRIARRELYDFIGDCDIALIVINESKAEGGEARKFLEDVRFTFPQALRVVKTRQVTHSVLNHLICYIENLENVGLIDNKETLQLHYSVQTDLKKLHRSTPFAKISDLITVHPFVGALPPTVHESVQGSTDELMKPGVTLYKEGSDPNHIWLVSDGVVKWTSKKISNKHPLHPTFSHGSTLGLYEVLSGKPYLCDMITDSVTLCFFMGRDKILSVLSSDPSVENFLWQESAIVLTKLFLPKIFEKMGMQELRTLIAEWSVMTVYKTGETVEISGGTVGFLLEGSLIKSQGHGEELITSPAAMLPSSEENTSFQNPDIVVDTPGARVIIFEIEAFEADNALRRRSSSFLPHYVVDHMYKERQRHGKATVQQVNKKLAAGAMQLSIFGSMVDEQ